MTATALDNSLGLIFTWESDLPSFAEVADLARLKGSARLQQLVAMRWFSHMPQESSSLLSLEKMSQRSQEELLEVVGPEGGVHDLVWLQRSMPDVRRLIRVHGDMGDFNRWWEHAEPELQGVDFLQHDLLMVYPDIVAVHADPFAVETLLDKLYLSRLLGHVGQDSHLFDAYVQLLVDNFNLLVTLRLFSLGKTLHEITPHWMEVDNGSEYVDYGRYTDVDALYRDRRDEFELFGFVPQTVGEVVKYTALRECQFVNSATINPDPTLIALQFARRMYYLFYNVKLLLILADDDELSIRSQLIDYDRA